MAQHRRSDRAPSPADERQRSGVDLSRRRLLRASVAAGSGILAISAGVGLNADPNAPMLDDGDKDPSTTTGYRESEHIRRYYETARL